MKHQLEERPAPRERLQALVAKAAGVVRPRLAAADMTGYCNFLNTMFHYTRGSGDKALKAARDCPTPELRAFFEHMNREERGHYLLAQADLSALGYAPAEATPAAVAAFDRYWASITPAEYAAYVGALVVFENIAGHVAADVAALVKRLDLKRTQARWLNVHVEADETHGKEALEMGEQYLATQPDAVLAGAEKACDLWIGIFASAFDERVELPRIA